MRTNCIQLMSITYKNSDKKNCAIKNEKKTYASLSKNILIENTLLYKTVSLSKNNNIKCSKIITLQK